jgi:hypothetical protein
LLTSAGFALIATFATLVGFGKTFSTEMGTENG